MTHRKRKLELTRIGKENRLQLEARVPVEAPFFLKQSDGARKKPAGRALDGRTWGEMPVSF